MNEDQRYGYDNPQKTLISLATDSTCPICGERPCTVITMASVLVLQAGTGKSVISAINYNEGLKDIARCIRWHKYGANDRLWRANHPSRWAKSQIEAKEASNGHFEFSENKDPPSLN